MRMLIILFGSAFGLMLVVYLAARAYLWHEERVAAQFLSQLEAVPIGVPAEPDLKRFRKYEDTWYEQQIHYPATSLLVRVDPWRLHHPFSRFDRLDSAVRMLLYSTWADWRRKAGLRLWDASASIATEDGKISSVEASIIVEGKSEWLMGNWLLVRKIDPKRLSDYRVDIKAHPESARYYWHWSHLHMGMDTGEVLNNVLSSDADAEQLRAGRELNLKCFSSLRGCNSLCDLMPKATRYRHQHNQLGLGWNSGSWAPQDQSCE